jgi:hypothetical protein
VRLLGLLARLADSNYELRLPDSLAMSERIIFPVSANEANGIEDARFVRFVDDDGSVTHFATYTAYNGHDMLPQLIRTDDFPRFRILTLNGDGVRNKGMALFPRRIAGRYAMLSRQDNENLFIMFSDRPDLWSDPELILRPVAMWESVKVGNCGSPIETDAGWLVITHGVGPMRKYSLGGRPARSAGPHEGHRQTRRAPHCSCRTGPRRLRAQRGLQLWLAGPRATSDPALRGQRSRDVDRERTSSLCRRAWYTKQSVACSDRCEKTPNGRGTRAPSPWEARPS